jgi:hypothetical protein
LKENRVEEWFKTLIPHLRPTLYKPKKVLRAYLQLFLFIDQERFGPIKSNPEPSVADRVNHG